MNSVSLILAHKNFAQVSRLVSRLLLSGGVVLHVDSKARVPEDFLTRWQLEYPDQVFLTKQRYHTAWGSFELVLATLSLLEEGVRRFPDARYFSLLSGQDYPIKSPKYLEDFFGRSESNFIMHRPLLGEPWEHGGLRRINRFYWAKNRKSLPGFFFRTIPFPPRRFPLPVEKLFVGFQWWSLRREAVLKILDLVRCNPQILNAFRWTYIPDEMFFQTVLMGFLGERTLVNDYLRFVEGFSLPRDYLRLKIINRNGIRNLGLADLEKLRASPALFARKFEATENSEIFDLLDRL